MSRSKTFILSFVTIGFLFITAAVVFNFDVVIRLNNAYKAGTLSEQKIRYEIAAYNLNSWKRITPIKKQVSPADGMVQVYVPEGEFEMGKPGTPDGNSPEHMVYLNAFWIDRVEVSNGMYSKCVAAGTCDLPITSENPYYGQWVYRDLPVVYVSWYAATTYCEWAGRRLPTEAEWEKAARGTDTRSYPWGNQLPNPRLANFTGSLVGEPVSVYRYPSGASPYGALNMAGNVREWIADWFSLTYYVETPYENPTGPENGIERSMRSGAYDADANEIYAVSRYKHEPQSAGLSRGFRCAESAK
ncbi:MAG: SUMF1/EgtB/PvdO family nonheme iron enzyme [Anaerolineales bacterium]|uniref:formylglycine-generating enzyme family protein n=1 Tax=Candidatus Villigracilis vicinus TaxID=3140679 RepID=UPI0031350406|nr:SUMF1/EgtB/PvdO family nonheme iron enzyme [Anaerolineales bacterium]